MKIDGEDLMNIRETRRLLDRASSGSVPSQDEIIEGFPRHVYERFGHVA